jgi:hypothetical protein
MQVGMLDIYPVFEPSQKITSQLFDVEFTKQIGPAGVPFFMHNQTVRAMIAETESITNTPFPEWFQAQGMLTEFILYSGFVQHKGILDVLYSTDCNFGVCNICHSEVGAVDRKFNEMQKSLTVSIHRNAWTQMTQEQRWQYRDFLVERGITKAGIL